MNQDCLYHNNIIQYCWHDNLMWEKNEIKVAQFRYCLTENLWDGLIYVGNIETSWQGPTASWVP